MFRLKFEGLLISLTEVEGEVGLLNVNFPLFLLIKNDMKDAMTEILKKVKQELSFLCF